MDPDTTHGHSTQLANPRLAVRWFDAASFVYVIGLAIALSAAGVPLWAIAGMTVLTAAGFAVVSFYARRNTITLTEPSVILRNGPIRRSIPLDDIIEMWPQTPTQRGPIRIQYAAPRRDPSEPLLGNIRVADFKGFFYWSKLRYPVVQKIE